MTPDHLVGRVQSATQFVAMASLPLAPLLAGVLLSLLGGSQALLVAGVLCGLVAIIPTMAGPIRSVPKPAQWPTWAPAGPGAPRAAGLPAELAA